jgi:hypothetical protein
MARKNRKHPILLKTSMYVPIPFYLKEEQGLTEKSDVEYERVENGLIIRVGHQ